MKRSTKFGVILLAIGLSFLGGTLYRSNFTNSFSYGTPDFLPLAANSWSADRDAAIISTRYFLEPRDLRMEIQSNSTIEVYILNAEGAKLWQSEGTLKPVWAFRNVTHQLFTLELPVRGEYLILIYNPANSLALYEINFTLFGFEKDLLVFSLFFCVSGLVIIVATLIVVFRSRGTVYGKK